MLEVLVLHYFHHILKNLIYELTIMFEFRRISEALHLPI